MKTFNNVMLSCLLLCSVAFQADASTLTGQDGDDIIKSSVAIRDRLERIIDAEPEKETEEAFEADEAADEELLPGRRFLKRYYAATGRPSDAKAIPEPAEDEGLDEASADDDVRERIGEALAEPEKPEVVVDEALSVGEELSPDCQYLDYFSGGTNTIFLKPGYKTDVILPAGEKLERVSLGDGRRFMVNTFYDRSRDQWHVYLNPVKSDVTTNIIISTDGYTFQAVLETSDLFKPFVRWKVPDSISVRKDRYELKLDVDDVRALHFGYSRSGTTGKYWAPRAVFDDGSSNTYVVFEKDVLRRINPILFTLSDDGEKILVPYKKRGDTLIINKVFGSFEICVHGRFIKLNRLEGINGWTDKSL